MKYLNTKPGSIEEVAASMSKYAAESEYQQMFKKELEKAGKGIGSMTPAEKKAFFNKIDSKYKAKNEKVNEGITSPSGQISQKNKDLLKVNNYITVKGKVYVIDKVSLKDGVYTMKAFDENGKMHTISSKDVDSVEHWKASLRVASFDPKNEQVKNPYAIGMAAAMKAKDDQPPLKKSTITKAHDIAKSIEKDEGFASDAQRKAAFASGYKAKDKKEELNKDDEKAVNKVKDMLKGASAKHASQAKMLDKALKSEEVKYPHMMYSKDGKEVEAKTPEDHKKYADMGYTHKNETHSFVTNKINQAKKSVPGEKQVVDPEPKISEPKAKMSFKEAYRKVKKEAMNTIGDANADKANQVVSQKDDSNDPDIKKPKGKTDAGTKPSAVDTSPEVDYKNKYLFSLCSFFSCCQNS